MGEFVIKAESRVLLDSEKPLLDVDIEEISVLNKSLAMDEQALAVNAPDIGQIQRAAPLIIQSGFVIVPRHFEFRSDTTAHTFMLRRLLETVYREPDLKAAADKARWEFRLADASGSTYMEFAGRGFAPEELKVPTRNARGVVIRPGNPYAGVLTYRDSFGELHTALSETFNLPGLVERMPKGYLLHLAVSEIFGKSPAWRNSGETSPAVKLTGLGEMIFQETADWIKFHGAGLAPAEVRAYFRREAYARELANAAADQLAQRLKRVRTTILVKALEVNDPLEERLEISIQPPR